MDIVSVYANGYEGIVIAVDDDDGRGMNNNQSNAIFFTHTQRLPVKDTHVPQESNKFWIVYVFFFFAHTNPSHLFSFVYFVLGLFFALLRYLNRQKKRLKRKQTKTEKNTLIHGITHTHSLTSYYFRFQFKGIPA